MDGPLLFFSQACIICQIICETKIILKVEPPVQKGRYLMDKCVFMQSFSPQHFHMITTFSLRMTLSEILSYGVEKSSFFSQSHYTKVARLSSPNR